jgi:hypothetical protein
LLLSLLVAHYCRADLAIMSCALTSSRVLDYPECQTLCMLTCTGSRHKHGLLAERLSHTRGDAFHKKQHVKAHITDKTIAGMAMRQVTTLDVQQNRVGADCTRRLVGAL